MQSNSCEEGLAEIQKLSKRDFSVLEKMDMLKSARIGEGRAFYVNLSMLNVGCG